MAKGFKDSKGRFRPVGKSSKSLKKKTIVPSGIPVYDININNEGNEGKKKEFLMWVVKHPDKPDRIKNSETIVRAEHYGQAIDDFITGWNKQRRNKITIGYPQVQGTIVRGI